MVLDANTYIDCRNSLNFDLTVKVLHEQGFTWENGDKLTSEVSNSDKKLGWGSRRFLLIAENRTVCWDNSSIHLDLSDKVIDYRDYIDYIDNITY